MKILTLNEYNDSDISKVFALIQSDDTDNHELGFTLLNSNFTSTQIQDYVNTYFSEACKLTGMDWKDLLITERLFLYNKKITDVNCLKKLTNLKILGLSHNQISNIEPLANLVNLTELFLNANDIQDITPLEKLVNLKQLTLTYNKITDIEPLCKLTNLKHLTISYNKLISTQTKRLKDALPNCNIVI